MPIFLIAHFDDKTPKNSYTMYRFLQIFRLFKLR